jgi:hypothetical protein
MAISRWLSEATPPVRVSHADTDKVNNTPQSSISNDANRHGRQPYLGLKPDRWCRYAQPPANRC